MKWISVKDQEPPKRPILVWSKCGMAHVANYDYDEWCHTENCQYSDTSQTKYTGGHGTGSSIKFTHWAEIEPPKDIHEK